MGKMLNLVFETMLVLTIIVIFAAMTISVNAATKNNDPVIVVIHNQDIKKANVWEGVLLETPKRENKQYSRLLQIIDYEKEQLVDNTIQYDICFKDCNNILFHYLTDDADFMIGDYFTAIIDDMGTDNVWDDCIISIRYERPDLFNK